jgi:hypothetical protein
VYGDPAQTLPISSITPISHSLIRGSSESTTGTGDLDSGRAQERPPSFRILHGFRASSMLHLALDAVRHRIGIFGKVSRLRSYQIGKICFSCFDVIFVSTIL